MSRAVLATEVAPWSDRTDKAGVYTQRDDRLVETTKGCPFGTA